jgi:hypothetical protein
MQKAGDSSSPAFLLKSDSNTADERSVATAAEWLFLRPFHQ